MPALFRIFNSQCQNGKYSLLIYQIKKEKCSVILSYF